MIYIAIILLLLLPLLLLLLWTWLNRNKHAQVVDSKTNKGIAGAVIKIYDFQGINLITELKTQENGYFDFFGPVGEYALLVSAIGYNFPSKGNKFRVLSVGEKTMIAVDLKNGGNKVKIFIDPV